MSLDPVTAIFELGKSAIDKIWPDPIQRAEQLHKLTELRQQGDLALLNAHVQIMLAQINVNAESARHHSLFVAGARPAVIWVGGLALFWSGIVHPLLTWVWAFNGFVGDPPPVIDNGVLGAIVPALLGVAGMRSFDKVRNKETDSLGMS